MALIVIAASGATYEYGYSTGYGNGQANGEAIQVVQDGTRVYLPPGGVLAIPLYGACQQMSYGYLNVTGYMDFSVSSWGPWKGNGTATVEVVVQEYPPWLGDILYNSSYVGQINNPNFGFVVHNSCNGATVEMDLWANPNNGGAVEVMWGPALVLNIQHHA